MIKLSRHIQVTVPLAAGLISTVLAGVIWMPMVRDDPASVAETTAAPQPEGPNAADLMSAGAEELVARPLFHMTRRPPVEEAPAPAPEPVAVTLSLTGIVNDENDRIALMRLSNQPDLLRRRVGDRIGNWEVAEITETSVKVTNGDGVTQTIALTNRSP